MNTKQKIIEQIEKFDNKYFNQDQKSIAIKILESAPDEQAKEYFDFIAMKRRTGFAFDHSPEIAKGRIIKPIHRTDLSLGQNNEISNKLLIGDNYDALKVLNLTHKNKVDIIYIDPPYNTERSKIDGNNSSKEGESNNFVYKDKFGRTGWLNMLKDRLELAKNLLKDDGFIYVSIDDSEQAYLKVLMDDIFGEENFIVNFARKTRAGGGYAGSKVGVNFDYVLMYQKTKFAIVEGRDKTEEDLEKGFKEIDENGKRYNLRSLLKTSGDAKKEDRPKMHYEIEVDGKKILPKFNGGDGRWTIGKEKYEDYKSKGWISIVGDTPYIREYPNNKTKIESLILDSHLNSSGTKELEKIFGEKEWFDFPKPTSLIKYLIKMHPNKNSVVLDFFAGSGTTGQAVSELNLEDDGNRIFILSTNNENPIDKKTKVAKYEFGIAIDVTLERLKKVFNSDKQIKNKNLAVIELNSDVVISNESEGMEELEKEIFDGIRSISADYNEKNTNLYYDLAALNPLEKDEKDSDGNDID